MLLKAQIQFTKTANQPDQGLKGPSSASLPRMTDCLSQFSFTIGTLKLTVVLEGWEVQSVATIVGMDSSLVSDRELRLDFSYGGGAQLHLATAVLA